MAKPRKRKATTTSRKLKGRVPAKRSTSRRKDNRAAAPLDDDAVFIPRRSGDTRTSTRANLRQPTRDKSGDDDDAVFVARAGRPIERQDDWTGASAPLGISNDEYFASLEPRAMTPGGWTEEQLREHGLEVKRGKVECRYGCGGSTSNVPGVSAHMNRCMYWEREGKHRTPFD